MYIYDIYLLVRPPHTFIIALNNSANMGEGIKTNPLPPHSVLCIF